MVVVVDHSSTTSKYGNSNSSTKNFQDFRNFMSSKVQKVSSHLLEQRAMRPSDSLWADSPAAQKKKKQADKEQDEQDDRDDKELLDILKTTKLVNNVTSSDLSGKDRRAFLQNRMVELGAKVLVCAAV